MKIHGQLTHRQQEVLTHLESGASLDEVATRLSIAPSTVKTHLISIFNKTGARGKIDLLAPDWDIEPNVLSRRYGLSGRQGEVLWLVLQGLTNSEAAKALWLSAETVKDHLSNIYSLVKVRSRYELAAQVRADFAHLAA